MAESALERVVRLTQPSLSSAVERVELANVVVKRHTRRNNKTGKEETVNTYVRHDVGVGGGLMAKRGVFSGGGAQSRPGENSSRQPSSQPVPGRSLARKAVKDTEDTGPQGKHAGGKTSLIHKDPVEEARQELIEKGDHLDPSDRRRLFSQMGITFNNGDDKSLAEQIDGLRKAKTPEEKKSWQDDIDNSGKASAVYMAMMDHANKEAAVAGIQDKLSAWDNAVKKFGKAGDALLAVRNKLMTSKTAERFEKVKETAKEWGKDVPWRVAEGMMLTTFYGAVVHATSSLSQSAIVGEHVGKLLEGRFTEAAMGAALSLGMAGALSIGKKHLRKVQKAKPRRALEEVANALGFDYDEGMVTWASG